VYKRQLLDGIGNAYADEILHRARLSPVRMTDQLDGAELLRLHAAARGVLAEASGPPPSAPGFQAANPLSSSRGMKRA
jgi:formamidopyrimidine-DNA glycosylase